MKTIKQTYHIKAVVEKVRRALVDQKEIEQGWKEHYLGPLKKYLEN